MERYLAKISTLLVEPLGGKPGVGKVFVAKPSADKEVTTGKLFGFVHVGPPSVAASSFINQLVEEIRGRLYAPSDQREGEGETPTAVTGLEEQFTAVLQHANHAVAELLATGGVSIDLDSSTMLVGNIRQQHVTFATVGAVTGYLFHYRPHQPYRVVTVVEGVRESGSNPLRLFTQTLTGNVGPLDCLFFCSNSLLDYLSLHTIKAAVTDPAGGDAPRQLKLAMAQANPRISAEAIIINLVLQRPPPIAAPTLKGFDYAKAAAKDSMRVLQHAERKTSRLLSPRLLPDGKKLLGFLPALGRRYLAWIMRLAPRERLHDRGSAPAAAPPSLPRPLPARPVKPRRWRQRIASVAVTLGKNPWLSTPARVITRLASAAQKRLRQIPLKQRLVVVGSLALVTLLGANIISLAGQRGQLAREKAFATVLAQMERLRDAAAAALIYQDEDGARNRLNEALQLLRQLPESYANHPTVVRHRRELNADIVALRREIVIADPIRLGNFANFDQRAKTAPVLIRLQNRLFTQDVRTKLLYKLDVSSRTMAAIQPANLPAGGFVDGELIAGGAVLLDSEGRLLRLDASETLLPLTVNLPGTPIHGIGVYRERLYLLNAASGTIFRADPTTGGFSTPRGWLQDPSIDLRLATDMTLDGDLFVLTSAGGVSRFRQGRPVSFALRGVDPPLAGPTKIKTADGSPYLYLLDPPTKRVVLVNKNGKLVQQYRSGQFDELRDLVVDEPNKTMYLLNGTTIYGVPMEHLP